MHRNTYAANILAIFCTTALLSFFAWVGPAHCQEEPSASQEPAPSTSPNLTDIVEKAGTLEQRLSQLKSRTGSTIGTEKLELRIQRAESAYGQLSKRFSSIQGNDLQGYQQLGYIKGEARTEIEAMDRVGEILAESMENLETQRRLWLMEKQQWDQWQKQIAAEGTISSVADALSRAQKSIEEALAIVSRKLDPLLTVQQKAGDIKTRLRNLTYEIDDMLARQRGDTFSGGMPTMFSHAYWQQLMDLVRKPSGLIGKLPTPNPIYLAENGWVIGLQVVAFFLIFSLIRHNRSKLLAISQCRSLGRRPVSLSLFVAIFTLTFLHGSPPTLWRMFIQSIASVAMVRLVTLFVSEAWVKRAIAILVLVMITFQIVLILEMPLAFIRLLLLIWSAAGMIYFGWQAHKVTAAIRPAYWIWLLRIIAVVFAAVVAADIFGYSVFAIQLTEAAIRTSILLLMAWVMIRLVRTTFALAVQFLPREKAPFLHRNADAIVKRADFFITILIVILVTGHLLVAWKIYVIPIEALQAMFSFGISLGKHRITVGLLIIAGLILYGAFLLSWSVQALLAENVLLRRQMDPGTQVSISRLIHYALVLMGFFMALSALGFELKNITIIGGALGVGIGFGMQAIVNNFVSGLILLFERPIKVGDVIQLSDGQQGRVTDLGLRATTIQTFDRSEVVVPNGDLIANQVTNWTLQDRIMRLIVPVGVAYGSDVEKVMRILSEVAADNDKVLKDPAPMALFLNFGDSSLDFQLRVWIGDFLNRRIIQSTLNREIDRRFRAEGIEIPFPQRDLHLRSVDETAANQLNNPKK